MKNTSSDDAAKISTSHPDSGKLKDSTQHLPASVVINDECGDSLWDENLAQQNDALHVESNGAKQKPAQ